MRAPKPKLPRFPYGWAPAPAAPHPATTPTPMPTCNGQPCNALNCQQVVHCRDQCGPNIQPYIDKCVKQHPELAGATATPGVLPGLETQCAALGAGNDQSKKGNSCNGYPCTAVPCSQLS